MAQQAHLRFVDAAFSHPSQLETLVRTVVRQAFNSPTPRVTALVRDRYYPFDARGITRFFADTKYSCFLRDGKEFAVHESLTSLALRLRPYGFVQVHRSELVNAERIRCVQRVGREFVIELDDGQEVKASRRMGGDLLRALHVSGEPATARPRGARRGVRLERLPRRDDA